MLRKRIVAGLSSNIVLQVVTVGIQFFGVPLCLIYWGENYYGEWLLLFTIPGYLGVSDLGLGTSSAAEMAMMEEGSRGEEINSLLRSVFWFIVAWALIPFGLLILSNVFLPWYEWLKLKTIKADEFGRAFPVLILYIYLSMFLTIPLNYYRVIKKYHIERYISSVYKILEFLVLLILVINGGGIFDVALGYLLLRTIYFLYLIWDLHRRSDRFRLFPISIRWKEVKKVSKPGFSNLCLYLGGNILNQGMTTIVGLNFGPQKLIMLNTIRTLVNSSKQIINILNQSLYGEFSYAFGAGNTALFKRIFSTGLMVNIIISSVICLGVLLFGEFIIQWWTHGIVIVDPVFLELYIVYTFLGTLSTMALTALSAINHYRYTAIVYLLAAIILIFINAIWIDSLGISYIAASLIVFEIVLIIVCFKVVMGLLNWKWKEFILTFQLKDILIKAKEIKLEIYKRTNIKVE